MNLKVIHQIKKHHLRLIQMVKDSWLKLVVSMGCMLIISASLAATAYLIRPVLDEIFFNKDLQMLKLIPIAVILLYTVRSLAMFAQQYLMSHIGPKVVVFGRTMNDSDQFGKIVRRAEEDGFFRA